MIDPPTWSIDDFVRVRRAFDHGNGPAAAWMQINEITLWRCDELAEQAGSRTWALLGARFELIHTMSAKSAAAETEDA